MLPKRRSVARGAPVYPLSQNLRLYGWATIEPISEEVSEMRELNEREQTLVALGAAIACNCLPCVEFHIPEARKVGCSGAEIKEAIAIADKVRRVPARMVLRSALERIEEDPTASVHMNGADCGCAG